MIKDQHGITLTELLVVAAIIMVMSAITIPNWNRGGERLKVIRAAHQLNQDIRRAQELTLANTEFENCGTTTGYGLHFESGTDYELFAECGTINKKVDSGEIKEEIELEEGVKIEELFKTEGNPRNSLTVVFEPPEPKVWIKDNYGDYLDQALIEITNDGFRRRVKINKVGLVGIDEYD